MGIFTFSNKPGQPQSRELILAAEREAQIVSAITRLIIIAPAIIVFLAFGGIHLPVAPIVLTYLSSYAFVSVLSGIFAMKRFFRSWVGIVFTAIDGLSLALLIGFVLIRTGTPANYFGAIPGFVFLFSIIVLATMRYTIGPVLAAFVSFFGGSMIILRLIEQGTFSGIASSDPTGVDFFFGDVQNVSRWWYVAVATILGLIAVIRRRKTLETAISMGQKTANLSRYLPDPISRLAADQGIDALSRGQRQQASILFVDIRGFTQLSENASPEDISRLLSEFRTIISSEVEARSGIVDKFIGDAVMAVFGVPEPDQSDASNALNCALRIIAALQDWNDERAADGLPPVMVSMGVHYGEVFSGAIGTSERLEFTVLGDTVNVAARLQELAKKTGSGLIVSKALLNAAGETSAAAHRWKEEQDTLLRGRGGDVPHFSLVDSEAKAS